MLNINMRGVAFLASLLLNLAVANAQDIKITYTTRAVPLAKAVAGIAKESGQKLFVSDELAQEPVVLRLKDVPITEAMSKIADEFVAEWITAKDGLQLTRTSKTVDAFESKFAAEKLAAIKESMKSLAAIQQSPLMDQAEANRIAAAYVKMLVEERTNSYTGDSTATRVSFSNRTGDLRLLATLVEAIGPETLATLTPGTHTFSLNPTAMESRIENVDKSVIDQFIQQHNMLAKAINAIKPTEAYDGAGNFAMSNSTNLIGTNVRPLIDVEVDPNQPACWIWLNVFVDRDRDLAVSYQLGETFKPADYAAIRAKAIAAGKLDTTVQLSPAEAELAKRYSANGQVKETLSKEGTELLAHPETTDPFDISFSTILLKQAERENRNLIASAPDEGWQMPAVDDKGGAKPVLYEARMTTFKTIRFDRPDGWLIVTPVNPLRASETRIDREALGEFSRAFIENHFLSIEDWARMATHLAPTNDGVLALGYWNMLRGQRAMTYQNNWDALRLYGLLSDIQLNALGPGGTLDYRSLTPDQQECLKHLIYDGYSLRDAKSPTNSKTRPQAAYLEGIDSRAAEAVPDGIPGNAQLTARNDVEDTIFVKGGLGPGVERQMNINELGWMLVDQELGQGGAMGDDDKIQSVRVGQKRFITFDLSLTDRVKMETTLQEDHYGTSEIPVDQLKDKLPADVWKKLDAIMGDARKARQKQGPVRSTPPPTQPPL